VTQKVFRGHYVLQTSLVAYVSLRRTILRSLRLNLDTTGVLLDKRTISLIGKCP